MAENPKQINEGLTPIARVPLTPRGREEAGLTPIPKTPLPTGKKKG